MNIRFTKLHTLTQYSNLLSIKNKTHKTTSIQLQRSENCVSQPGFRQFFTGFPENAFNSCISNVSVPPMKIYRFLNTTVHHLKKVEKH